MRQSIVPASKMEMPIRRTGRCSERQTCRYVHDASKVAVCPHWLQGRCSDEACPLQHQHRPELMPVCTFFLQVNFCCPNTSTVAEPQGSVCGTKIAPDFLCICMPFASRSVACRWSSGQHSARPWCPIEGIPLDTGRLRQGGLPVPAREPGEGRARVRGVFAGVVPRGRRLPREAPHARHGAPAAPAAAAAPRRRLRASPGGRRKEDGVSLLHQALFPRAQAAGQLGPCAGLECWRASDGRMRQPHLPSVSFCLVAMMTRLWEFPQHTLRLQPP